MADLIDRKKIKAKFEPWLKVKGYSEGELNMLKAVLYEITVMPSAQPDVPDTNVGDMISRQSAIDALHGYFDGMLETDTWSPCDVYGLIEILPSAQPECDDTVSRKAEIDAIKRYIRGFDAIDVNFLDGLKTAIQIIEQLPHEYSNAQNTLQRVGSVECEDTVSRQAAIDTVRSYYDECDEREESIEERIERLPSADVQPVRHGHWIPIGNVDADGNQYYNCSICECGETHVPRIQVYYCWNCGARMDGEENG